MPVFLYLSSFAFLFSPAYVFIYLYGTTHPLIGTYEPFFDLMIVSIISILLSWFIKAKYVPTETPDELRDDFYEHPFYIFYPKSYTRISSKVYGTKYVYPKRRKTTELLSGTPVGDIFLDLERFNSYPEKNIFMIQSGETIITEEIRDIFIKTD